ncbi:hypothetical protein KGQ20_00810 [Catenulispora sp. NF23]|uniref:hypothetical protein n=1 Tax=Catenulispora pinistramenti TaxID=2705254 RepID=UPI001BABF491|nr:hypothetical protein [Catenulispora pinistramenti]MBS2531302.1 hypothetical protein [Catenulispora pinistramenti]
MRMPFSHEEPQSRLERVRCAVRDRTSGAAHSVSGAAGTAQSAAANAAGVAQDTAQQVAGRATVVAHQVADRASVAAAVLAERARPVASEAASRGGAAWQVMLHGAPQPSPMSRVAAVMPVAVTTVARRGRAPLGLMAIGALGAVGLLWWRRSRAGADSVWILDSDSDVEPVGRWQEGDRRGGADDTAMDPGRRESPANRWP